MEKDYYLSHKGIVELILSSGVKNCFLLQNHFYKHKNYFLKLLRK